MLGHVLAISLVAVSLVVPRPALATYSTVALERATGRYGAVTASCVELSVLQHVYASVPGRGAVLTQSYLVDGDTSRALALQLLVQGAHATEVVEAMTAPQFDADFSLRQYVVLDSYGSFAGFTGGGAEPFAGHLDASDAAFSVGIAGNFLTAADVLEAAALGFRDEAGCDFEEHLVNALVAASAVGLGDARCVAEGRPAQSVWLHVAGSNGADDLDITVDAAPGIDPTVEVLTHFSEWRSDHPCPVAPETPEPAPSSAASGHESGGCSIARNSRGSVEGWVWGSLVVLLGRRRVQKPPLRGPAQPRRRQKAPTKAAP